ncbi:MAG: hypothetical protein EAZ91_03060 [Cytophagales bacterium]|nr:MAG: hypothetical protein EAZ91_03060 [Cytophagales bacterium]
MHPQRNHLLFAFLVWLSSFVHAQAQTPTVSLTVSNALSCSQLSATLTAATSCTGGVSYRFTGPNDFVLETTSPVVSVTVDGEYTVVASNTATGCTATRSATLTSTLHPDYLPLVDLYRSTNGPNWTNNSGWLINCEPCSGWYGIVCWRNQVVFLDLDNNQLKGTLPSSLHQLKTTTSFWFAQNQLQGNIPASLTLCQNMVSLRLNGNQLVGIIPAGVTSLTGLNWLDLSENQLTGIIPQDIDNLTNLGGINLEGNQLTGTVPVGLTALTRLDILRLGDNQLTGPIPSGFGKDGKQMQQFLLQNNRLTGPLPADLGNLTDISYYST